MATSVPNQFEHPADLRTRIRSWQLENEAVVLVPTMGALHAGHLALITHARTLGSRVVVSIFVNPSQFGPTEDFSRYPRNLATDVHLLQQTGVDAIYTPDATTMYPPGFSTRIDPGPLAEELCGAFRPGHFSGVATIVTKLLTQLTPDHALFGEKDYQQLHIIRQVVRDLDIPVTIHGMPTIRETDGLALSSRNRYLTNEQREVAPQLHSVLASIADLLTNGNDADQLLAEGIVRLHHAGFSPAQYLELRDATTLLRVQRADRPARLLAAGYLGQTRLIDNVPVSMNKRA